ncbi:MAG: hypothetical protein HUU27_08245, partial [Phycisphaerae bacterium]|nr:hypothetical protein [Phycisphaerae bacterium]
PAGEADEALEARARADLRIADARLELILARKALRQQQPAQAEQRARRALALLRDLPEDAVNSYVLQAEGILARAHQAGTNGAHDDQAAAQPAANGAVDRQGAGAENSRLDTPQHRYVREQLRHQGRVREAIGATEVRELTSVDEARVVPPGDIFYPSDWPQRTARRALYADGALARSDPWVGKDGKQWQVVVYDVSDLTYVTPDFMYPGGGSLIENMYNALDRDALRRSQIFHGYAEDLAAGIPLLNFFGGGIDPLLLRGPKYSAERQEQVVQMIHAVLDRTETPTVISLPPPR